MRLAILTSHPIQYYAPLFRHLATRTPIHVFFAHKATALQQASAGFGHAFDWDVDLTSGYTHTFLHNRAANPSTAHYGGCDTPDIAVHLCRGQFDAVLTLGWHLKSFHQGIWAAKRARLPVLVRGDSQLSTPRSAARRAAKRLAYPILLRAFDAALYVGQRNKRYYEHYDYPTERLFSSPHCVDTDRFAASATREERHRLRTRLGVENSTRLVLFAGKLVPFKRPLDMIDALAALRTRGHAAEALVAGSGTLERELLERGRALGVPLHHLGFQNQSEMPAAYAAADALVLPSNGRETWGLVCNEALACGLPIVTSDAVGCAPDLAADGHVGRTYRCGDVIACADALEGVLFNAPPAASDIKAISAHFGLAAAAYGIMSALEALRGRDRGGQLGVPAAP